MNTPFIYEHDFEVGDKVRVVNPGQFIPSLKGATGTVVGWDAYTVEVKMDIVTEEMKKFEDGRTGLLNFNFTDIEKI